MWCASMTEQEGDKLLHYFLELSLILSFVLTFTSQQKYLLQSILLYRLSAFPSAFLPLTVTSLYLNSICNTSFRDKLTLLLLSNF